MCDDGSVDDTYKVAENYKNKFPQKIVLIKNDHNMGLNQTLNNCLKLVSGEYVARMDGDDVSLPERFEKEAEFLNLHPEFAIVSTPMVLFDETGDWGRTQKPIEIPQITDFVYHTPFHCHAPCMIRREAYFAVNGYTVDPKFIRFEDCNLWFKLYGKGYRGYNLSEPLYKMRDDKKAIARRDAKTRLRGVYVLYTGFEIVGMPKRYYFALLFELIKSLIVSLMPTRIYKVLHRKKQNG